MTPRPEDVPMRDAVQYVLTHILLARYWTRRDCEGLEFLLHGLRGEWSTERKCDRCQKKVTGWQSIHELVLCHSCIIDFIESKTTEVVIS